MTYDFFAILFVEFMLAVMIILQAVKIIRLDIPYRLTGYGLFIIGFSVLINIASMLHSGAWFNSVSPFVFTFGIIVMCLSFFVPSVKRIINREVSSNENNRR